MEQKPTPTADELARLADIAEVRQENREYFLTKIIEEVLPEAWMLAKPTNSGPRSKALSRAIAAIQAARQAIVDLNHVEGDTFGPPDDEWLQQSRAKDRDVTDTKKAALYMRIDYFHRLEYVLQEFLWNAGEAYDPVPLKPQEPRRGRRSGGIGNRGLQQIAIDLLFYADRAGGNLTVEKNTKRGTLAEALHIIAPYTPPGAIPKELPFSTLQRIKTGYAEKQEEMRRSDQRVHLRIQQEMDEWLRTTK
jgi:hypothetical protein